MLSCVLPGAVENAGRELVLETACQMTGVWCVPGISRVQALESSSLLKPSEPEARTRRVKACVYLGPCGVHVAA